MDEKEPEITDEERELLRLLDEDMDIPPLPPDFERTVLATLGFPPQWSVQDTDTEPEITDEEWELLRLLDEDIDIPPLPRDFEQKVLAQLGIFSQSPVQEADTAEELYQRGLEAVDDEDDPLAVERSRQATAQGDAEAQYHLGGMNANGRGEVTRFGHVFTSPIWARVSEMALSSLVVLLVLWLPLTRLNTTLDQVRTDLAATSARLQEVTQTVQGQANFHQDVPQRIPITVPSFKLRIRDGQDGHEYLSSGISTGIVEELNKLEQPFIRASWWEAENSGLSVQDLWRETNFIVAGSLQVERETVHIEVWLMDVKYKTFRPLGPFNGKLTNLLSVQETITQQIVKVLGLKLTDAEQSRLAKRSTDDPQAYDLYMRGRFEWNKRTEEGFKKSIAYFNQAINKDQHYALALAGLADSYSLLGNYSLLPSKEAYPRAAEYARKALDIDNELAEAHTALAVVMHLFYWDWPKAEEEFKQAIKLNPRYATAHQWYADYLIMRERFDEAYNEVKEAQAHAPWSAIISTNAGWVPFYARRYEEATTVFLNARRKHPDFASAYRNLGRAYEQQGRYEDALSEFQKALTLNPNSRYTKALLGHCYAVMGKSDEAEAVLKGLLSSSPQRYGLPYNLALIYIGLGKNAAALEQLEEAYMEQDDALTYLKIEPAFENLRSEPRFKALLQHIRLTP